MIWGGRAPDGSGGSGAAASGTEVGGGALREAGGEFGLLVSWDEAALAGAGGEEGMGARKFSVSESEAGAVVGCGTDDGNGDGDGAGTGTGADAGAGADADAGGWEMGNASWAI